MYKLVALWSAPKVSEVEAFENYYRDVHVPKATVVPGLKRILLTRIEAGLEGAPAPFYRVAEMYFENPQAMEESAQSDVWKTMREDAGEMIERFGVTLTVGMGWEEDPRQRSR
jgi:uncharacterized protein (TIGR02118 family)